MSETRIGCSGWAYKDWRGPFYPETIRLKDHFAYYASRFDTTEINGSFYRLPTEKAAQAWADQAPDGFLFAWKVSRYITHNKKLKDCQDSVELVFGRILTGQRDVAIRTEATAATTAFAAFAIGSRLAALDGGPDGLQAYRDLAPEIRRILKPGGTFAVEIGFDQGPQVKALFEAAGFTGVIVVKDLGDRHRVVTNGPDPRTNPIPKD